MSFIWRLFLFVAFPRDNASRKQRLRHSPTFVRKMELGCFIVVMILTL
jgi:hypothetical protein